MSSTVTRGTLPIRRWLALALIAIFVIPACAIVAFAIATVGHEPSFPLDDAVELLRDESSKWHDPEWRSATAAQLAEDDIAFVLFEDGREIYRSMEDPITGVGGTDDARVVKLITIEGTNPDRSALVYGNQPTGPPPGVPAQWFPVVALGALALTLIGIGWLIGRTVLKPLGATSEAARQVASGDLDVALPRSRVREVTELNTTFEVMTTELKRSLEQQAELEQERRLLIGAVAHDLRTPLFTLRGYLEGLETGLADTPEKRERYLAIAQDKALELERLIADLFDYTRLEYLDQAPERQRLDLVALLQHLVEGMSPQAAEKGVQLRFDEPVEPCFVVGDAHLLTRAVENLLDNALRHTPGGGSVRVDCRASAETITFSVSDTGTGIPEADLPHIFTPLFRGETSRNRRTGGAGLGLTIARRILLAHGGDLEAGNNSEGGAIFTGHLPAAQ